MKLFHIIGQGIDGAYDASLMFKQAMAKELANSQAEDRKEFNKWIKAHQDDVPGISSCKNWDEVNALFAEWNTPRDAATILADYEAKQAAAKATKATKTKKS